MTDWYRPQPAVCLMWCLMAVWLVQMLPSQWLPGLLLGCCLLPGLRGPFRAAIWRMRWLLLATLLLSGWSLPGEPLWASPWSPSRDGLFAGLRHGAGLWCLAGVLLAFWQWQGRQGMLAALWPLIWLTGKLGAPAEPLAVRLVLTLHYMEQRREPAAALPGRGPLARLQSMLAPARQEAPDKVQLLVYPWTRQDILHVAGMLCTGGVVMGLVA